MKKVILFVLVLVSILALVSFVAAEQSTHISGDFEYSLNEEGTAVIKAYSGDDEKLEIPFGWV